MKTKILSTIAVIAMLFCGGCATAIRTNLSTFQNPDFASAPGGGTATIVVGQPGVVPALRIYGVAVSSDPTLEFLGNVKINEIDGNDVSDLFYTCAHEPANPQLDICWTITAIDIPAGVHELTISASGVIERQAGYPRQLGWGPAPYVFSYDFQAGRTYMLLANAGGFRLSYPLGTIFLPTSIKAFRVDWLLTEKLPDGYPAALKHRRETGNNVYDPTEKASLTTKVRTRDCITLGRHYYGEGESQMDVMEE